MIARGEITKSLGLLDKLFNESKSQKKSLLYSKLAILELCGWIEEEMDDLVYRCCKRTVANASYRKLVQEQIIARNYGFTYEKNFRSMLIQVIGLKNFEALEKAASPATMQKFKALLQKLKPTRDTVAHSHLRGTTIKIDAPSVTLSDFYVADAGFRELSRVLRMLKL